MIQLFNDANKMFTYMRQMYELSDHQVENWQLKIKPGDFIVRQHSSIFRNLC